MAEIFPSQNPVSELPTTTKDDRVRGNIYLWSGTFIVGMMILAALFAPLLTSVNPNTINPVQRLLPLGTPNHLLGTDELGRDVFARLLYGGRVSITVGVIASFLSTIIGVILGLLAGYGNSSIDNFIMRSLDVVMGFPFILIAILVVAFTGPSTLHALLAVSIASVPFLARIIRSEVLKIKTMEFIQAAESLGASHLRILIRHILPGVIPYVISVMFMNIGWKITEIASLSFLGLGTQPPTPEWGSMLAEAQNYLAIQPLVAMMPGLAIVFTVTGFNLLGLGLRQALDVHKR